jgi:hypothetical protein
MEYGRHSELNLANRSLKGRLEAVLVGALAGTATEIGFLRFLILSKIERRRLIDKKPVNRIESNKLSRCSRGLQFIVRAHFSQGDHRALRGAAAVRWFRPKCHTPPFRSMYWDRIYKFKIINEDNR